MAKKGQKKRTQMSDRAHFFNRSLDMLCIVGFDGYFKDLNPRWENTLGDNPEKLRSMKLIEAVHPEDRDATRGELEKLATEAQPRTFENRYRCQDSTYKRLQWRATPDANRQLIYAVVRPVEEKSEEEKTREGLERLLSTSPLVIYSCKPEGDFGATFISENVKTLMGYEPEDFISDPTFWSSRIHPEDKARIFAGLSVLFEKGHHAHEYRFRLKDGSYCWMHDKLRLIRDAEGKPIEMVGCWQDISDRFQMEDALKRANQELETRMEERTAQLHRTIAECEREIATRSAAESALHKEREFLNVLLDNLTDGIIACDPDGKLTRANRATQEYCGLPEKSIPLYEWPEYYEIYEADGKTPMPVERIPLARALQGETSKNVEMVMVPKQGKPRTLLVSGQAIADAEGTQLGAVVTLRDISDRKAAEAAKRESESRLNSILNGLKDVVWSVDPHTFEMLYLNPAAENLYESSRQELFDHPTFWIDRVHPADRDSALAHSQEAIATGNSESEYRIIRRNGEVRHLYSRCWLTYDETGHPLRLDGTLTDITDLFQAQKNQARLTAIIDATPDFVGICDASGKVFYVNPAGLKMTGFPEDIDVTTVHISDFYSASMEEFFATVALPTAATEGVWSGESRLAHRDGREIPGSHVIMSHKSKTGEVECFSTVFRDITEQKAIEDALRRSATQLAEAQKVAHLGSWELDVATQTGSWSEETFRIFGWEPRETPPSLAESVQRVYPEEREKVATAIEEAIATGKAFEIDHRILRPDGSIAEVSAKGQATMGPEGQPIKIFGTVQDISDRKRAEAALRRSEELYRALARNFPNGAIVLFDTDLRYTLADGTELSKLGLSKELMEGKTLTELFPPELCENIEPTYRAALGGETTVFEVPYQDNIYLVHILPVRNTDGEIFAGMSVSQNITELKQIEAALRESEAQFRQLAEREALINRLARDIRNSLEVDTILETVVQEIHNLLALDRCLFAWYRIGASDRQWNVVQEAKLPELPSAIGSHPVEEHPLLDSFLERELLCEENVAAVTDPVEREVYQSWGYVAFVSLPIRMSSGDIGILNCGHHTTARPWSDSELELLKSVRDQLAIALYQAELYSQAQDNATQAQRRTEQLQQTLQELKQTQAQLIQTEKMSGLGQMVAGVAHEINNPVNFIYGNLTYLGEYATDLLTIIQLYQEHCPDPDPELSEAIEEMELDFLVEDLPKIISSIKLGTERIRQIVLSLRNFSRLDEADMKEVDLHQGIDNTLLILQNRLKSKPDRPGIQVVKEYGSLPLIQCYAGQMNQVFMNILNNAIDALESSVTGHLSSVTGHLSSVTNSNDQGQLTKTYGQLTNDKRQKTNDQPQLTNDQGQLTKTYGQLTKTYGQKTIHIRTQKLGDRVSIQISDNGPGMTESVKSRLFDPFFTTKPVGKGTGLGLSIGYQIVVDKHGGTLQCDSTVGQGTLFTIEIPISQS
ncbi:PAS domain-containing protein [Phormidium sp. CCY1219]|uniref:PAS domain-containing protein n=1 Tax=Phormidium sp. CCY1219 TaxID=2886104 RepID=UPI002D782478|nr:PAS domain-containing protein [Phormidium sp. CCY1219]